MTPTNDNASLASGVFAGESCPTPIDWSLTRRVLIQRILTLLNAKDADHAAELDKMKRERDAWEREAMIRRAFTVLPAFGYDDHKRELWEATAANYALTKQSSEQP